MARTKSAAPTAPEGTPAPQAAPEPTDDKPVTLTGRLTADPILRRTKTGIAVTNLRVAVNHDDGTATFHSVVAWKRTAEVVAQFMKKGRLVEVTGHERTRTWTGEDGAQRTGVEINAYRVQFLSRPQPAAAEVGA
jgi:single-strand DNA-binding protein